MMGLISDLFRPKIDVTVVNSDGTTTNFRKSKRELLRELESELVTYTGNSREVAAQRRSVQEQIEAVKKFL
jgi:hypothetical protein